MEPETVPSPLRMDIVQAAVHGVMSALTVFDASPAERASIARSVYITVMLDLVRQWPGNFEAARGSMRSTTEMIAAMLEHGTVEALEEFCRRESLRSTFSVTDAPRVD